MTKLIHLVKKIIFYYNIFTKKIIILLVKKIIVVCIGDYVAVSRYAHSNGSKKRKLTLFCLKG